ncbi:hypothetical protein [Streptococcus pluranimalium]|uniref:hypothetical protein n=1 Tax=Streptococcus pluranimalium TaxID=82348 RepID=UPI003F68E46E
MGYDFHSLTKQIDEADNRKKFYTDFEDVDPNTLHQISDLTEWIRTKGKGSDVREVIAQLFERTWMEGSKKGNANLEVAKARGSSKDLSARLQQMDISDKETNKNVEVIRSQISNLLANAGDGKTPSELIDLRIGLDGYTFPTAGESLRTQLSMLIGRLEEFGSIAPNFVTTNLLKDIMLTTGKFIFPNNGSESGNSAFSASGYIAISSNVQYVLHLEKQTYGAWYDAQKVYISGLQYNTSNSQTVILTPPTNAKYIRLSYKTSEKDNVSLKKQISEEPYLDPAIKVSASQIVGSINNVIKVKFDGTGDFTSLKSALESIKDSSNEKQYIVEFYGDGSEYNVLQEFSSTDNTIGLSVPPFTKLVGVGGKSKNILVARLSQPNQFFSTINLNASSSLEGFTIIGKNTRYAVHDDFYSEIDINSSRSVQNCAFISEGTYYKRSYGAGIRSGCHWTFENCIFDGRGSDETAFSCHNNSDFDKETTQLFENCRFRGTASGPLIRFGSITKNANNIINNVIFKGCVLGGLLLSEEKADTLGRGILFKVSGYSNDVRTGEIRNTDGNNYQSRIDLI